MTQFKVLSDEEIMKTTNKIPPNSTYSARENEVDFSLESVRELLKAQHEDTLRQVMEWGMEDCPHVSHSRGRHWCGDCWQYLKQAIEEGK